MRSHVFSIKDIVALAKGRQERKFDFNIAVSGPRGNGKSTFLFKLFLKFPQFKPKTHMIYKRKEVMRLLEELKYGVILDDEAIRTGYKRNFFETDQKLLVQMMNMYRDNFNIYGMAIPNFYSLDKDVRDLIKIHIQIVERGVGVIHIAQSSLYSDDHWDINYNKKIEDRWAVSKKKNPNFKPPYHKLSTFFGYVKFGDLTAPQRRLYEEIKSKKRKEVYDEEMNVENKKQETIYERIFNLVVDKKMTKDALLNVCLINNLKYSVMVSNLNKRLKDQGIGDTLRIYLQDGPEVIHSTTLLSNNHLKVTKPRI